MLKTDTDKVVTELSRMMEENGNGIYTGMYVLGMIERLIVIHTHRTEEDLPEDGVYWVRIGKGYNWFIVRLERKRVVWALQQDAANDVVFWQRNILKIEFGPKIEPPKDATDAE